jgi:hypothetical protein
MAEREKGPDEVRDLRRGQAFNLLYQRPEWIELAEMCDDLRKKWTGNLTKFSIGQTLETIALERVKWTSMVEGLERIFIEMNECMEFVNQKNKEEEDARRAKPVG